MSTATIPATSLSISHEADRAVPTRLRLTRRGRVVLASLVALPLAGALAWSALGASSAVAAPDDSAAPGVVFATVTLAPGETLWAIASEVAPTADPRDVVDAIKRLNALDSAQLVAGQRLAIPAQYAAAG